MCHFRRTCSLKSTGKETWECSEYQTERVFRETTELSNSYADMGNSDDNLNGLCKSCELLSVCTWYKEDRIIFHCEHYK